MPITDHKNYSFSMIDIKKIDPSPYQHRKTFDKNTLKEHSKPSTRIAFLNADFRNFQGIPAFDEDPDNAILVLTYAKLLEAGGWKITHLLDCPLSTERFTGNMVSKMQEKRTLGIVRRTLIIGKLKSR